MTIQFNCSGCGHVFRVPDEMAGRKGKCPKCAIINQIPLVDGSLPPAAPAPAPAQAVRRQPAPPPRPAPIEDEVVDEAVAEDGEVVAADADTDAPKKKRSLLLPALIGGGALLLLSCCTCVPLGAYYFFFTNGTLGSEKKYFPTDAQLVLSVRVEQGMNSDLFKKVKGDIPKKGDVDLLDDKVTGAMFGVPLSNIDRLTAAGISEKDFVIIVRTRKSIKGADVKSALDKKKFEEIPFLSYTIYEITEGGDPNESFCAVESNVVVYSDVKTLKAILDRGKEPELSASMQKALKNTNWSNTLAVAVDAKSLQAKAERASKNSKTPPNPGGMFGPLPVDDKVFAKVEALSVSLQVDSDLTLYVVADCKDSSAAEEIKKNLDSLMSKAKDVPGDKDQINELTNNTKISQSGSTASVKIFVKGDTVTKSFKAFGPMLGGGIPGMGMGAPGGPGLGGGKKQQLMTELSMMKSGHQMALDQMKQMKVPDADIKKRQAEFKKEEDEKQKEIDQAK